MKKIISIILCLSLITLVSCTDKNAEIYSKHTADVSNQNEESESSDSGDDVTERGLSGTLKISSLHEPSEFTGWYRVAMEFQKIHPNVKFEVNDTTVNFLLESAEQAAVATQKYEDDLKIKMNSGDVPDIIISMGSDSTSDFIGADLMQDFNELMESDSEFAEEDYFENVLKSQEIRGALYTFPIEFNFVSVRLREDVLAHFEIDENLVSTVDYKFLYDTYFKTLESAEFSKIKYINREIMTGKALMFNEMYASCFDAGNMNVNFNTPEFIEYLEITNNYTSCIAPFGILEMEGENTPLNGEDYFVEGLLSSYYNQEHLTKELENVSKAFPVSTQNGEIVPNIVMSFGMPKNAQSKELAWEFIKYYIAESETPEYFNESGELDGVKYLGFIPINKNNLHNHYKYTATKWEISEKIVEEFILYVEDTLSMPMIKAFSFTELNSALQSLQADFYNGLMTAEECAKAMQDRAEIYFAEIE